VRIEEQAQKQAQKKTKTPKSEASKSLPVRNKTPAKPKTALNKYKKQVRFVGSEKTEWVVAETAPGT
jgi:hypothetical protein